MKFERCEGKKESLKKNEQEKLFHGDLKCVLSLVFDFMLSKFPKTLSENQCLLVCTCRCIYQARDIGTQYSTKSNSGGSPWKVSFL